MLLDLFVTFLLLLPALLFITTHSDRILDYMIWVVVLNRGIRRIVDWYQGAFNPYSPISLTPLVIAGMLLIPAWTQLHRLDRRQGQILSSLGIALLYGGAVGFVFNRFSAIYAFAEYLSAFAAFFYVMVTPKSREVGDRWMRTIGWTAIAASLYGWFQYYTIPAWDAFWVEAVGFVGYLGNLASTEMTVFSTMAERGPLASYLAFALVAMIVTARWRPWLGWVGIGLVTSVIFLTMSRTGIILPVTAIAVYVLVNRGANFVRIAIVICVLSVGFTLALQRLPGAERLQSRFATLGAMQEDGSFQGRLNITRGFGKFLSNPIGLGLGSTGMSVRVAGENAAVGDSGYLEILANFGWVGFFFLGRAFYLIWAELKMRAQVPYFDPYVGLGRALMVALIPAMFVGNFLSGVSLIWIALGLGISHWPRLPGPAHPIQPVPVAGRSSPFRPRRALP